MGATSEQSCSKWGQVVLASPPLTDGQQGLRKVNDPDSPQAIRVQSHSSPYCLLLAPAVIAESEESAGL